MSADDIIVASDDDRLPNSVLCDAVSEPPKGKGPSFAVALEAWMATAERDFSLQTTRKSILEDFREKGAEVDFVPFIREISGRPTFRVNCYGPPPKALEMIRDQSELATR